MDYLNDTLDEAERDEIAKLVFQNFPGLDVKRREAANFYRMKLHSGRECHVKVFKPNHKRLYAIENHALRSLSWTGRVSPVLYSSPNLDGSCRAELKGSYFLVKPHFKTFLEHGAKHTKLLDDAAQLVSLAQVLKEQGWYDFDENWENEAFTEDSRLIRFDMDAAFPCNLVSSKFNADFHAPHTSGLNRDLNNICEKLVREDLVFLSLAVKLSRFLLNRAGDLPELIQQLSSVSSVAATHNGNGSSARYVNLFKKSGAAVVKSLRAVSGVTTQESLSINQQSDAKQTTGLGKPKDPTEAPWLKLWETKLGTNRTQQATALTIAESRFLGLLFSHILQNKAAGWELKDFRYSLLLLLAAKLQNLTAKYSNAPEAFCALVDELYEFKCLALPPAPKPIDPVTEKKADPPVRILKIAMEEVELEGGEWITTKKQGTGGCQDLVLKCKEAPFPFFVLADGESNANGGKAIKILEKQCREILKEMGQKPDARDPKQWITHLISRTNDALLKGQARTTVVIGMLYNKPASVLLAQFGNSPWVYIKEDAAGGPPHVQKNPRVTDEKVLGKDRITDNWITEEIREMLLEAGTYHIRAFSDGIPESQYDAFMKPGSITELVEEVSRWGTERPNEIGHDDWSVAGLDFTVNEETLAPVKPETITPAATASSTVDWFDRCAHIPPSLFQLSVPARDFWRRTLADEHCRELAQYSVIKDAGLVTEIRDVSEVTEVKIKPEEETTTAAASTQPSSNLDRQIQATRRLVIVIFALLGFVVAVTIYQYCNQPPKNNNHAANNNADTTASASTSATTPSFNDPEQRNIFNLLNSGNDVARGPLAAKSDIDEPPLKELIPALAVVLRETSWRVSIQIHTTLDGDDRKNFQTAKSRSEKILAALKARGIPESQIKLDPKGEASPLYPHPKDGIEALANRRIVIRRRDDSQ